MRPLHAAALSLPLAAFVILSGCSNNEPEGLEKVKNDAGRLVTDLRSEVAALRGKNFLRPVASVVYTRDQYAVIVGADSTVSAARRDTVNRVLRCEGLLHQNEDYYENFDSMTINQAGGFYKNGSDTVFLIVENGAGALTGSDSFSVFHEMVHAMQDQYYGLESLKDSRESSDQYYAMMYCVEGEAELLSMYYSFKLYYGYYPASSYPIMQLFNTLDDTVNAYLDSLHNAGEPLITYQPAYWSYYSYGPLFIDAVAGTNWSLIDNVIFASLPQRTSEVMHPQTYVSLNRYVLNNIDGFIDNLDTTQVFLDVDELGEVLTCVLFREWNFGAYFSIAAGLRADRMLVFRDSLNDTLRLIWYTLWSDSAAGSAFMANYSQLLGQKRGIAPFSPVQTGGRVVYSDTVNNLYAEQSGSRVFVMEQYRQAQQNAWIQQLRSVTSSVVVAKRVSVPGKRRQLVKKDLWRGRRSFP